MKADFWHSRWQENKIGFHVDEVNPYLLSNWGKLGVAAPATVFLPLCGKSVDIVWFINQGFQVEAVELSSIAIESFIKEQGLTAEHTRQGDWQIWAGKGFRIWCGDYFNLTSQQLGNIDAVYDRAALIALPEEMRQNYVFHMKSLVGVVPQLLITLSYEQAQMDGPPFSVSSEEVNRLYGDDYLGAAAPVVTEDVLAKNVRFADRGVRRLDEHVFVLQVPGK